MFTHSEFLKITNIKIKNAKISIPIQKAHIPLYEDIVMAAASSSLELRILRISCWRIT